jgi:hypothetical protein
MMKNQKVNYYVKPEAGKVIGRTNNFIWQDFIDEATDALPTKYWNIFFSGYNYELAKTDGNYIKAIATCSDDDKWDEKIGKEIVNSKLDMKVHQRLAKKCRQFSETYFTLCKRFAELAEKHEKKADAIKNDLERHYCEGAVKR